MKQNSNKNEFDVNLSEEQTNKLQQIFGINKGRKFGEIKANNDKVKIYNKIKKLQAKKNKNK